MSEDQWSSIILVSKPRPPYYDQALRFVVTGFSILDKNLDTVQYESPYQATSAGFEYCANYVDSLMSKEDLNFGASAFLGFFVDILQKVAYVSSGASISSEFAIQLQALCEAAENKTVFNHLMVYLAFRQEKLSNYDGGEDPDFGPSTVLRKSSTLKKVLKFQRNLILVNNLVKPYHWFVYNLLEYF